MNNQKIIEEITKLSEDWYKMIGCDHHKDRDCHWYIETVWSYGQTPKYSVVHHGYILDKIDETHQSYEQALLSLKETIKNAIVEEKKWKSENLEGL